jgi:hypothetical protein
MPEDTLPVNLQKRLEELKDKEESYWEDEMFSVEALTNPGYRNVLERNRRMLERSFNLDPLA